MSGGGSNTTTVQKSYTPEEEAMRKFLMQQGQQIYSQASPQFTSAGYPGAAPIPASPQTQEARQALTAVAGGPGKQVADVTGQALQFGLRDVLDPNRNPALQTTLDTATRRIGEAYTDPGGVISNIRHQFTAGSSGGASTRESIAGGLAGRSYLNTIGDVTGRIMSDAYGQGLDTFGRTLAFTPQAYNTMLQPAQTLATVGGSVEAEKAAQENFQAAQRQWSLNAPWMGLQNLSQTFTGLSSPGSVTQANAASNPMMGAAGGAMAGWALAAQSGGAIGGPMGAAIGALAGLMLS